MKPSKIKWIKRKHYTKRRVNRRLRILNMRNCEVGPVGRLHPGFFRKYNLVCSCYVCSYNNKIKKKGWRKKRRKSMRGWIDTHSYLDNEHPKYMERVLDEDIPMDTGKCKLGRDTIVCPP